MRTSGPLNTRDDGYDVGYTRGQHAGSGYGNSSIVENFELENEVGRGSVNRPLLSDTQRSLRGCPKLSVRNIPVIIFGVLLIILVIAAFAMFLSGSPSSDCIKTLDRTGKNDISNMTALPKYNVPCMSGICTHMAGSSLEKMAGWKDKCKDFYLHMCDGFLINSRYPVDQFKWDVFSEVEEQIKNFMMFLHEGNTGINTFDDLENEMYLRCATEDDTQFRSTNDARQMIKEVEFLTWKKEDMDKFNNVNETDAAKRRIYFQDLLTGMDSLGLPFYLNFKVNFNHTESNPLGEMEIVAPPDLSIIAHEPEEYISSHLHTFDYLVGEDLGNITERVNGFKDFQGDLSKALNQTENNQQVTWAEAKATLNIEKVLNDSVIASEIATVEDAAMVLIRHMDFFTDQELFIDVNKHFQAVIDLARISLLYKYRLDFPNYIEKRLDDRENVSLAEHRTSRCLLQLPLVLLEKARNKTHMDNPTTHEKALEVAGDLRNLLVNRVNGYEWMDSNTKKAAKDKLNAVSFHIGFKNTSDADVETLYEYHYGALDDYKQKTYIKQVQQKNIARELYNLKAINKRWNDVKGMHISFNLIYPVFHEFENALVIPIGMLNHKFVKYEKANDTVEDTVASIATISTLGLSLARELIHCIDAKGGQYDKDGKMVNWMSADSLKHITSGENCVATQYSAYTVTVEEITGGSINKTVLHLNGKHEAAQNLADAGGLSLAYEYHLSKLANNSTFKPLPGIDVDYKRLFYTFSSQLHCAKYNQELLLKEDTFPFAIGKWRVIGPLENLNSTAADLECPDFPVKSCGVF